MSRPRRNVQAPKYDTEESDEEQERRKTDAEPGLEVDEGDVPLDDSDDESPDALDTSPLFASVPNAAQVLQTQSFVVQQSTTVALLREQYQEQKLIADELHERLKHAEKILFEAQATIAPLNRVPPEVLSLIFIAHVRVNQESPWFLMQVSRFWRAAARGTRDIWAGIVLAPSNWAKSKGGSLGRVYNGMEVCYKEAQLRRALTRAGAVPLDLKIMLTPGSQMSPNHDFDLIRLINCLSNRLSTPRLRSLNIDTEGKFTLYSYHFAHFDFSSLVSLVLDRDCTELIEKVVAEAQGMHTLHVAHQSLDKMGGYTSWSHLEDFTVEAPYGLERVDKVLLVLSSATGLTSLGLGPGRIIFPEQTPSIHLPSLKRLESYAPSNLWVIQCPNLTHLSLHVPWQTENLTNRRVRFPHLVEMLLDVDSDEVAPMFDVPSLVTLDLRCGWSKAAGASVLKRTWPPPRIGVDTPSSNLEPTILWFQKTEINPKIFARSLVGRKVLEELFTVDCPITEEFFDNLLPVLAEKRTKKSQKTREGGGSQWQLPCPALKILSVDLIPRKKFVKGAILASAGNLVATRIKAGAPLERLTIRFSKDEGWEELVLVNVAP